MVSQVSIGTKEYETIADAIASDNRMLDLKLLKAVTEDVIIPEETVVTIDLAGFTLTNVAGDTITVRNRGTVKLFDSSTGGKVDNITNGKSALNILPGGVAEVGVECVRSTEDSSANTGNIIVNQGSLVFTNSAKVTATSTTTPAIVNGFATQEEVWANGNSSVNFVGGTYTSAFALIKNKLGGYACITDGDFDSTATACIVDNEAVFAVKGGDLTSTGGPVIANGPNGVVTITGGKFTGKETSDITAETGAVYKVMGGVFKNTIPTDYLPSGYSQGGSAGAYTVVTTVPASMGDGAMVGGGFLNMKRMIVHFDTVAYKTGGIELPAVPMFVDAVIANVDGGIMAYYDRTANKVKLYSARSTEVVAETELTDVSLIVIGL